MVSTRWNLFVHNSPFVTITCYSRDVSLKFMNVLWQGENSLQTKTNELPAGFLYKDLWSGSNYRNLSHMCEYHILKIGSYVYYLGVGGILQVLVISFLFFITSSSNFSKTLYRRRSNLEAILCCELRHFETENGPSPM